MSSLRHPSTDLTARHVADRIVELMSSADADARANGHTASRERVVTVLADTITADALIELLGRLECICTRT